MPTQLVTRPSAEPVTLAEAKLHLRVDITDDDALITSIITVARQRAETITRRSFITQTWQLVLDAFPAPGQNVGSANWYGPQWGNSPGPLTSLRADGKTGFEILLEHAPIAAINSITYTDVNGVVQTLDPSQYKVDLVTEPCRVVPAYGTSWPGTRNEINAVVVNYTCGYGADGALVPEPIKAWIKMRVAALYENREEITTGRGLVAVEMPFMDGLLQDFRLLTF